MTAPRAKRGRSYASERFPEGYYSWAEDHPVHGVIFDAANNPHYHRDMRMISRRRML